jgi:hypothetical protein
VRPWSATNRPSAPSNPAKPEAHSVRTRSLSVSPGARTFLSAATSFINPGSQPETYSCSGEHADKDVQCRWDLTLLIPEGWPRIAQRFNVGGGECRGAQVPKGRLKPRAIRQSSLRDSSCRRRWLPTLKRWAIIVCPSGTMIWPGFAGFVWKQVLAALDENVRAPINSYRVPPRPRLKSAPYQRNDFCSPSCWLPSHKVTRHAVTRPNSLYASPVRFNTAQCVNHPPPCTGFSSTSCLG